MKPKPWSNLRWGVLFTNSLDKPTLISSAWHDKIHGETLYEGEPTRALVFCTRKQARDWCRKEMDTYAGRTDCCSRWKFTPVRVQETVRVA